MYTLTKPRVAQANTKLGKQRNWALKKAEELLKAAAPDGTVEVLRKPERKVTVNSVTAFFQPPHVPRGSFEGQYSHLQLPA